MEANRTEDLSIFNKIYCNLSISRLVEMAILRNEGLLTTRGALRVETGKYTGRSPEDKYIVDEPQTRNEIWWGRVNKPMAPDIFEHLYERLLAYLKRRHVFVFDGFAGADERYRYPLRFVNELAWQNIFAQQLFIKPRPEELDTFSPYFTVLCAPGFQADPEKHGTNSEVFVAINFSRRLVLIGGSYYAGEIKKAVFTVMNYLLPKEGVLPMHCAANAGPGGEEAALFFGLSGTGKTSLSADAGRFLVGDDEHGWSEWGIFNIEGGCYAKCINLSRQSEPQIWEAIRFGCVVENAAVDPCTGEIDFSDDSITENTRAGYPVDHISGALNPGVVGHPRVLLFLTADAFGVLPPVARLDSNQAMYHFLSGYTSKLAGTERGITEPRATFSTCFGAPFLPLSPVVYARMLGEKIKEHGVEVYLVNTGWVGGCYGVGRRIGIDHTRCIVRAAIKGSLKEAHLRRHPVFGFLVPDACDGVPNEILWPENIWDDKTAYRRQSRALAEKFKENFAHLPPSASELANVKNGADTRSKNIKRS